MSDKLGVLSAELKRCQQELYYLGMEQSSSRGKTKLIISTGDISDVDGFFALAEYAKTTSHVLFIMNYPNYLQKEKVVNGTCVNGLGFVYDAEDYRTESEAFIMSQIGSDKAKGKKYKEYLEFLKQYTSQSVKENMKTALTDLAFFMAYKVWGDSGGDPARLFFCIGGVNTVNPFAAVKLKNELFVYHSITSNMKKLQEFIKFSEGDILNHNGIAISGDRCNIKTFVGAYEELYIDFNGSMAFFDTEWASCLQYALSKNVVKGVFVAGGVFSDQAVQTMPSISGELNRLSCATMNQLYHPSNTFRFFDLMQTFNANVVVVTNNQVSSMDTKLEDGKTVTNVGWEAFLKSNQICSTFMISLADAYYNSIYSPARKPFDFYTAQSLVAVLNGRCLITQRRTLHYNSIYGIVIVGKLQATWKATMQEYINGIDITPSEKESVFVRNKKQNFSKEIELLQTLSCASITVLIPEFTLQKQSYLLSIRMSEMDRRNVDPNETWFVRKFGSVCVLPKTFILGIPIFFKQEADVTHLSKIMQWPAFNDWVTKTSSSFVLNCIVIQSVDMFGPIKVGFVKFKADVFDDEGLELPAIVFMRGGSVGILVIIECEKQLYTILLNQARVPIGSRLLEIPAGMLDGNGKFAFIAAKEMEEETGIKLDERDLVDLTEAVYGKLYPGIYPSAGGCDEFIRIFLFKTSMTKEKIAEVEGRETGEKDEGEKIKVKVIPLENLAKIAPDMKSLSALALYRQFNQMKSKEQNLRDIPDPNTSWRDW